MAAVKKTKRTTNKVNTVPATRYEIDGYKYRTKTVFDYHKLLAAHPSVKTFQLPTVELEADMKVKKFHAFKAIINGIEFDSLMESKFYIYLLDLQQQGEIKSFEMQKTFELQPKFKDQFSGKTIRAIDYIADFVVVLSSGQTVAVDVKGIETVDFKIKKKLFQYKFPDIRFMCVQWVAGKKEWLDLEDIKAERRATKRSKKSVAKSKKTN